MESCAEKIHHEATLAARDGDMKRAADLYRSALRVTPYQGETLFALASITRYSDPYHIDITAMKNAAENRFINDQSRRYVLFALGKALDDCGNYDDAWECFSKANSLTKREADIDLFERKIASVIKVTETALSDGKIPSGLPDDWPLFIIGVPRSGTTLVESIIAKHHAVTSSGESDSLIRVVEEVKSVSQRAILSMAAKYCAENFRRDFKKVSNKNLFNALYLWIAALMFPNMKAVSCRRNPIDSCLSIYFQPFRNGFIGFDNDLRETARFVRAYSRLAAHWRTIFPEKILDVHYEDVVRDKEGQTRRMLDFIGLPWDDACLDHQSNKHSIETASMWQVRQPIYDTSIGRWKNYEKHLAPLMEALEGSN